MAWTKSFNTEMSEADIEIIIEAQKRFKVCEDWESQARTYFEYDYKFANGDSNNMYQWDNWVIGDRNTNQRPCLTINKTQQHNLQIINDGKQNKPGVNIRPVGDDASFEAAQVFQEVVRHIEYISNAENVYDNAATFQVNAGWGYWRLTTEAISDMSFDKEIYIRRIKDPRSVYLDPDINEVDGSDARFGFIFSDMPRDLYETEYPDYKEFGGPTVFNEIAYGWIQRDSVRVCEYFKKSQKADKLVAFTLPETGHQIIEKWSKLSKEAKNAFDEIKQNKGDYRERDTVSDDIIVYKIAGNKIIDKKPWLGKYVPIIRLIGSETVIDGVWDCKGHTRALLDPQRLYNINSSSNVEYGALQSKAPWIAPAAAIENLEEYWKPLALDTPLPTPSGWTTMGEVKIGDWLFDENGQPIKVVGMSPIHLNRVCYKVTFDDGSSIVSDEEHLWTIERRKRKVANAEDWMTCTIPTKLLEANKDHIWCSKQFKLEAKVLIIDPYVLGYWLGDGSSASNRIHCDEKDAAEIIENLSNRGYWIGNSRKQKTSCDITVHGMRADLVNLNLINNKHIPFEYLRASHEQRLELLQGLMDSDGHYHKATKRCIFTNTNKKIIDGIIELLKTLGIKSIERKLESKITRADGSRERAGKDHYNVSFSTELCAFKLDRKASEQQIPRGYNWRRVKRFRIISIEEVISVPVRCVAINSESHLFLAGKGMVPTHNTANITNHSVLPWNHIDEDGNPIPPPSRPAAPQSSPAYVEQMKIAQEEMMMVSGQYQAQMGENENAKSGVAINARQRQGDRATYHFIDNQAIAIRFTGKQLIDLIPKVYDTKRVKRIEAKDGTVMDVTIDPKAQGAFQKLPPAGDGSDMDNSQQIIKVIFNPNVGIYDVQSDTGPSFATRRQEAFNALTQIAAQNKEFMNIGGDLLWKVADFPEAQELARRWRKIIPPNILGDAPNPQTEKMMHDAADHIQMLTGQLQALLKKEQDREREFEIKERELTLKEKVAGHDATVEAIQEIRADFEAISARITSLGNSGPAISQEQIAPLIKQAIAEALVNGGQFINLPGPHEGGTPIALPEATNEQGEAGEKPEEPSLPGVPGSRLAPDGKHYVQNSAGQHLEVQPIEAENA